MALLRMTRALASKPCCWSWDNKRNMLPCRLLTSLTWPVDGRLPTGKEARTSWKTSLRHCCRPKCFSNCLPWILPIFFVAEASPLSSGGGSNNGFIMWH